jgi:hypothetical protein
VTVARLNSRVLLERRAGSKAEEVAWKLLPRGAGLVTDTLPAGNSYQGGMTESLEMPRFGWRLWLLPLFLGSLSVQKGRGILSGPRAAKRARGAASQPSATVLLRAVSARLGTGRRNGKRQRASGGVPPRCVAGLEKLRGSRQPWP